MAENRRPLFAGGRRELPANFDRYDWTRGTAMNRHNTDNVGAKLWADCDWAAGVTTVGGDYAFNHIYSTNLGDGSRFPKAITPMPRRATRATCGCGTPSGGGISTRRFRRA